MLFRPAALSVLVAVSLVPASALAQDRTADNRYTKQMRMLSGSGMVALIFTVTFASIDWYMSLEPEWFSTIYGFIFVAAWTLSALAFVIAVMASVPLMSAVTPLRWVSAYSVNT